VGKGDLHNVTSSASAGRKPAVATTTETIIN
jgi:hypothetical protein